ncbi:MAG: response regulator [Mesorhizobium sp.]
MNQNSDAAPLIDFSTVVVVAKSPINRIVLARIVERTGLRPIVEAPETAAATLLSLTPGAIVLDGGTDNRECHHLGVTIASARRACGGASPAVILLSSKVGTPQSVGLPGVVDTVIAKPITPEKLQPVIERLIAMTRS